MVYSTPAMRLPHDVSWVHSACSGDPRAGNEGRHEQAMPKGEAVYDAMSLQAAVGQHHLQNAVARKNAGCHRT